MRYASAGEQRRDLGLLEGALDLVVGLDDRLDTAHICILTPATEAGSGSFTMSEPEAL